ncbi:MAG TPA: hypothetical protein PLF35_02085 [Prolixibacteraceae bacterium]|nr:hypothetical protein [Prolixibacteraceae bacterium]
MAKYYLNKKLKIIAPYFYVTANNCGLIFVIHSMLLFSSHRFLCYLSFALGHFQNIKNQLYLLAVSKIKQQHKKIKKQ